MNCPVCDSPMTLKEEGWLCDNHEAHRAKGIVAFVLELPECSFCMDTPALYDAKTINGYWAFLCQYHMEQIGIGVGTGIGQRLVVKS